MSSGEAQGLHFDAAVFDLDGVVTLTASVHAAAWKRLFDGFLESRAQADGEPFVPFDREADYLTYVDGKPRIEGVKSFLASRGIELPEGDPEDTPGGDTAWALGNLKNGYFRDALEERGVDVDEATVALIHALRERGIRIAVASSSKNCEPILRRAGLESLFEARVDGVVSEELGLRGKPEPDIFVEAARRIGTTPDRAIVFEDAQSGVAAGRAGGFGLVVGIQREATADLRFHGADLVVDTLAETPIEILDAWFEGAEHRLPSALAEQPSLDRRIQGGRLAVFLDYDGTLSPIVSRPELAVLSPEMRRALERLAAVCFTAIVSGRGREDVASLVGIPEMIVAGSHGFDIAGPERTIKLEMAAQVEPLIKVLVERFRAETEGIEGVIVEDKRFSLAVHYRLAPENAVPRLERLVDEATAAHDELRKTHGKKVFELRPKIEWDKGKALLWLLEALDLEKDRVIPLYIGDDVTDEDAFVAIADRGIGILVSSVPRATAASYWLQDTGEVRRFLEHLAELCECEASA
jgi:alpha,alpha-trehalase